MESLEIVPGKYIGEGHPCFIVAEVGQNHQGDLETAKKLIQVAQECGADCVKFQKCDLEAKFNHRALQRPYSSSNSWGCTYGEHKRFLEFSTEKFCELIEFGDNVGIPVTASAMDMVSLEVLLALGVPFIKIGSGDATNIPLIRKAAESGRPLVISTGMSELAWVKSIYEEVTKRTSPLVLLQCTSSYPTPPEQLHLRVMDTYAQLFPLAYVGYSGHEKGIHASIAAAARGAKVIERHITLDQNWKGSDHCCSLLPDELKELVVAVRTVESALGSPLKEIQPSEEHVLQKLGKSVVASRPLTAGQDILLGDITVKVADPKGIPAHRMMSLEGRILARDVDADEPITEDDIII